MRLVLLLFVFLMVVWSAGCARTGACPEGQVLLEGACVPACEPGMACTIPLDCLARAEYTGGMVLVESTPALLDWELTVGGTLPSPVEGGEPFTASLEGVAVINESLLDTAQLLFPDGVKEGNVVDLRGTVHMRSGATGDDETLTIVDSIPYECSADGAECSHDKDLEGVPGARGNTDCEPVDELNPCGRFVLVPTTTDCAPGGVCELINKTAQCSANGFCVTGDLRLPLQRVVSSEYMADSEGKVLVGWADESTGATIDEPPVYDNLEGPLGLRITIGTLLVSFDCTMRAADEALIMFPIETP
jgi:hypothetical protein